MPLRWPKMYSFICGFQRLVWWPKCTPASKSSFIVTETTGFLPLPLVVLRGLARAQEVVLLALLDPRVPRQETGALERRPELPVELHQGPGDGQPHGRGRS